MSVTALAGCRQATFTLVAAALYRLQPMQTADNLRKRGFLTTLRRYTRGAGPARGKGTSRRGDHATAGTLRRAQGTCGADTRKGGSTMKPPFC